MGYTHTLNAVTQAKDYLDVLRTTLSTEVVWPSKEPRKLVYQLHRALASAEILGVPSYSKLKALWQIRTKEAKPNDNQSYVIARRRVEPLNILELHATDSFELIELMLTHKTSRQTLSFPVVHDIDTVKIWIENTKNVDIISEDNDRISLRWRTDVKG